MNQKNHRESKMINNFLEKWKERHKVELASWETFPNLEAGLSTLYTDNQRTRKKILETFPNVLTGAIAVDSQGKKEKQRTEIQTETALILQKKHLK